MNMGSAGHWIKGSGAIKVAQIAQDQQRKLFEKLSTNDATSDGTWGYSSPNHRHIVFCADTGRSNEVRSALIAAQRWAVMGEGVYKNEAPEPCFIMRVDDFYNLLPYLRAYMVDQESVLRLGHLKAQNWRDAHLIYGVQKPLAPDVRTVGIEDERCEFAGTFMSVTEDVAKAQTGYTLVNGHYYTVIYNPPHNEEERKERAVTQAMANAYVELAARNAKYAAKHGEWRKSTQAVQSLLFPQLQGATLENGHVIDEAWFQEVLKTNNVH